MDIATLWEVCLQVEYDRQLLVDGLEEWLGTARPAKLLDCACGTGFPSLDLIQRGYDVTCADASPVMLSRFARNARARGLDVQPVRARWQELGARFGAAFDVVMCRGNSLIYADAWDADRQPDPSAMREAISSFRRCLRPGGLLYVDTTTDENLSRHEPERHTYGPLQINGNRVKIDEVVETDRGRGVRYWHSLIEIDGAVHEIKRHSHYLPHEGLLGMLRGCGFRDIEQVPIKGERYAVFVARNPAAGSAASGEDGL